MTYKESYADYYYDYINTNYYYHSKYYYDYIKRVTRIIIIKY